MMSSMNKHSYLSLAYSNTNPIAMTKCGPGTILIEKEHLSFQNKWNLCSEILMPRDEIFILRTSFNGMRIFNRMYKFLYIYSKNIDQIVFSLKEYGYMMDISDIYRFEFHNNFSNVLIKQKNHFSYFASKMIIEKESIFFLGKEFSFSRNELVIDVLNSEEFMFREKNKEFLICCMPNVHIVDFLTRNNYIVLHRNNSLKLPIENRCKIYIVIIMILLLMQLFFLVIYNILE